jgi:hypothetical protein
MVEIAPVAALIVIDASVEICHLKASLFEQSGEHPVQFVAESATLLEDEFFSPGLFCESDGPPQMDVQILEWDSQYMGAMDIA